MSTVVTITASQSGFLLGQLNGNFRDFRFKRRRPYSWQKSGAGVREVEFVILEISLYYIL